MQHGYHSDADICLWNMYLLAVSSVEDTDEDIDRALWAMKAAKDRREEFYDRARKDNIFGRNKTRLPDGRPGQIPKVRGRPVLKLARGLVEARQQ